MGFIIEVCSGRTGDGDDGYKASRTLGYQHPIKLRAAEI